MSKIHVDGQEFEVFEKDTMVMVEPGSLISSPAKVFLLQTTDRKKACVALIGSGGETFVLHGMASRVDDGAAEHLRQQARAIEARKG
jgi:hypothetical protein